MTSLEDNYDYKKKELKKTLAGLKKERYNFFYILPSAALLICCVNHEQTWQCLYPPLTRSCALIISLPPSSVLGFFPKKGPKQ